MKVLLLQPPIEDFYDTSIRTYPLGLLYIAAKIKDACHVSVVDLRTGEKRARADHPFPGLKPFYREGVYTPFSLFSRFYRFGLAFEGVKRVIEEQRPDIVGISSLFSAYAHDALQVARAVKQVNSSIITVLGGLHPTLFPEHVLADPDVDFCIRGEGETPFLTLVTALASGGSGRGLPGVSFRAAGRFHISDTSIETDIDLIPARDLVPRENYRINRGTYTFLLTSRGCPLACAFCGKPPVPYRQRSLAGVEKEVDECLHLGISSIDFEDDMLNLDRPFFQGLLRLFSGKGLTLSAMNGIYPDRLDRATLTLMYEAGFRRLNISLVDVASSVLRTQKRRVHGHFLNVLPYLESSPFLVETHFIIGLPGQTPEEVLDTMLFLMGKRVLLGPSIYYMAPGSPLFETRESGEQVDFRSMRSSLMFPHNTLFPREITFSLVKLVRFINYVKHVLDRHDAIRSLSGLLDRGDEEANPHDEPILRALLLRQTFICCDRKKDGYVEETQDHDLVRLFFQKARGLEIRGYKTMNSLTVDM